MSIKVISGHPIFNENAIVLSQKYNWKLETDFDPRPNDLYVVLGAHELAHQLLEIQFRKNSNFGYVILNSEQINSQFLKNKYYINLMKRNVVCDWNTHTSAYLKDTFDIKVFSYFYFEFMMFNSDIKDRFYDIAFVGTKSERRENIMNELKEKYPDLNIFVDMDWKHKSSEQLNTVLHNTKLVLNIPYHNDNALETHRINKALSCGCDVISHNSCDEEANDFYKDYAYMTDDIVMEVEKYYNGKVEKKKYEELVKELSMKIGRHFAWVISQIHQKLLSLHNKDDAGLPEQTGAVEVDEEKNDEAGKKILSGISISTVAAAMDVY